MSEKWIEESRNLLKRMNILASKGKRDRLDIVNSIRFTLDVLDRSILGWKLWMGNLSLMSQFTSEELADIEMTLKKQIQPFIEYDIKVSRNWEAKFPKNRVPPRDLREEDRGMYV